MVPAARRYALSTPTSGAGASGLLRRHLLQLLSPTSLQHLIVTCSFAGPYLFLLYPIPAVQDPSQACNRSSPRSNRGRRSGPSHIHSSRVVPAVRSVTISQHRLHIPRQTSVFDGLYTCRLVFQHLCSCQNTSVEPSLSVSTSHINWSPCHCPGEEQTQVVSEIVAALPPRSPGTAEP